MDATEKGKSPFYPSQPVPVELFVGRRAQIEQIMQRGVGQVLLGKPQSVFVQGEYGIGKSSIAAMVQRLAEQKGLHPIYATLGAAHDIDSVAMAILEAVIRSGALHPSRAEALQNWLAKYIGEQQLFTITLRFDRLKQDSPTYSSPGNMVPFLGEVLERLRPTEAKGLFLVLDEINGVAGDPAFAHFIKGLVDVNAMSRQPVPLLLMLCGVEERRHRMIMNHQPVERLFDIVEIDPMTDAEVADLFTQAFNSVGMQADGDAIDMMVTCSAGLPKIAHLIGDAAFWRDRTGRITLDDAAEAILECAEQVGKRYVDQQLYRSLRSEDYHAILRVIGRKGPAWTFTKSEVARELDESQRKKLNNFLQRLKRLGAIRSGDHRGEYVFNSRMAAIYVWLRSKPENRR